MWRCLKGGYKHQVGPAADTALPCPYSCTTVCLVGTWHCHVRGKNGTDQLTRCALFPLKQLFAAMQTPRNLISLALRAGGRGVGR